MTNSDQSANQSAFEQARAESQALPSKPDNLTLLKLYSLYKQGSEGDVTAERPSGFDFIGAAKYDAWAGLKGKSQAEAQAEYVALVERLKGGEGSAELEENLHASALGFCLSFPTPQRAGVLKGVRSAQEAPAPLGRGS